MQEIRDILASVLFYPLGWIGMFYKYPNSTQRRLALAEQHSGSYYHAGKAQAGKLIGMLWKVVLVYFFATLAFRVLKLFVK